MGILIPVEYRSKPTRDIWAGFVKCPKCGTLQSFHYCRVHYSARLLYFIPIFSIVTQRGIFCDNCGIGVKMKGRAYRQGCREQMEKLKQGKFPPKIIAQDCDPEKLKLGWKTFFLVIAILWALSVLSLLFELFPLAVQDFSNDTANGITSFAFCIFMLFLGIFPLYRAIKSYRTASQRKRAYNRLIRSTIESVNK